MGIINKHMASRMASFRAARLAIAEQLSMEEAARREGSKRTSVTDAHLILKYGTEQEIASVEAGISPLGAVASAVRLRVPKEDRPSRPPQLPHHVNENREYDAQLWGKLRDALDTLTSLPIPEDMMKIIRKNAMRTEHVGRKVLTAHTWLEEFVNAWTK
jgi:hypothetical protein